MIKNLKRATILTLFLSSAITLGGTALANVNSPQGALDIAGILPGQYGFITRDVENKADLPAEENRTEAVKAGPEDYIDAKEVAASAATNVNAIIDLMRTATQTTALLPPENDNNAALPATTASGVEAALKIACAVPDFPQVANARQLLQNRALLWPCDGKIYSTFHASRGRRGHGAIDIVNKRGTPIQAAADGVVAVVANGGKNWSGYGRIVIIDHGQGVQTLYAHCNTTIVKQGQRVRRGEIIATVGRTGRATTDHCHFEVRTNGKKIDPLACLPSRPEMIKAHNYKSSSKGK